MFVLGLIPKTVNCYEMLMLTVIPKCIIQYTFPHESDYQSMAYVSCLD